MSVSIDFSTYIISVPKSYLTLISGILYNLDTEQFRLDVHAIMDDEEGIVFPFPFSHNTEVTLGGLTYARIIEILSPYTITFEDGQYRVILIGSNNNILDVSNVNQVSISPTNSAGLTNPGTSPAAVATAVWDQDISGSAYETDITKAGTLLNQSHLYFTARMDINEGTSKLVIYDRAGTTPLWEHTLTDKDVQSIVLQGTGPSNRSSQTPSV